MKLKSLLWLCGKASSFVLKDEDKNKTLIESLIIYLCKRLVEVTILDQITT
jgi:hypothetical protein